MNIFKFLKIQQIFLVVIFLLLLTLFFFGIRELKNSLNTVYNDRLIPVIKIHDISDSINRSRYKVLQAISSENIFNGVTTISLIPEFTTSSNFDINNLVNENTTENERIIIIELSKYLIELKNKEHYIFNELKNGKLDNVEEILDDFSEIYIKARSRIEKLIELQKSVSEIKNKESIIIYNKFIYLLAIYFLLSILISVYLSINIRKEVDDIVKIKEYQEFINNQIIESKLKENKGTNDE